MKILILGVNGMLGHKLYQVLSPEFDVTGTIRGHYSDVRQYNVFNEQRIITGINAQNILTIKKVIAETKPDVVINCIGIIKQIKESHDKQLAIWVNSLFPHQLQQICSEHGARLIHMSTDCVFSGEKGNYREDDPSDAEDIYGKSKYLGEIDEKNTLTIRTSLIGRELRTSNSLLEWFIAQRGKEINGFTRAIFSGFPTLHMARIIRDVIVNYPALSGIYHISSEPISKYELLSLVNKKMGLQIKISPYNDFHCDRSLDSTRYREKTHFKPMPWDDMITELAQDTATHYQWRN